MSCSVVTWWRHQMETFSALLAFCAGKSPAIGEFPTQKPVTWSFDVSLICALNKRLSKQSWGWWFETPSCSLWRHRNELLMTVKRCSRKWCTNWNGNVVTGFTGSCHSDYFRWSPWQNFVNMTFPFHFITHISILINAIFHCICRLNVLYCNDSYFAPMYILHIYVDMYYICYIYNVNNINLIWNMLVVFLLCI